MSLGLCFSQCIVFTSHPIGAIYCCIVKIDKMKKYNLLQLSLLFFSLPILISVIFIVYAYKIKNNLTVFIPDLLTINNNELNIKKLIDLNYNRVQVIQYLKLYDFLCFLIFIFAIPYCLLLIPMLFGTSGKHIKSFMFIAHMKAAELSKVFFGIILFSVGFVFIGVHPLFYFMDYELKLIRLGYLTLYLFITINTSILSLAAIFSGHVMLYKYFLLKNRRNSKKHV